MTSLQQKILEGGAKIKKADQAIRSTSLNGKNSINFQSKINHNKNIMLLNTSND